MTELSKTQRFVLSILTGTLLTISFPFSGSLMPLIFIAWVPLLVVENSFMDKSSSGKHVFLHAYLGFFIYNLGSTWWIWNSTAVGGILAFLFNTLLMALAFLVYHLLKKRSTSYTSIFLLPLVWVAFEYCHFNWELSWPWLTMGNVFSEMPEWIQWYEYTGVLGGSLWILLINTLIAFLILRWKSFGHKNKLMLIGTSLVVFLLCPLFFSFYLLQSFELSNDRKLHILAVQPNIDPYNEKFSPHYTPEDQLAKFYAMIAPYKNQKIDLVMGPETMLSADIWEEYIDEFGVIDMMKKEKENWPNTEFLVGAATSNLFKEKVSAAAKPIQNGQAFVENYNTSLFLSNSMEKTLIHKSKLVLGVEKIPFATMLPFLENFALENGGTSGSLGVEKEPKTIQTAKGTIAPVICYESIYGEFVATQCAKGAEAICIITNDGWWGDSPGYKQHFSISRIRAIENRRWVIRSANTGKSGFISPIGEITQETAYWEPATINQEIVLNSDLTFYSMHGDYLGYISLVAVIALIIYQMIRALKNTNWQTKRFRNKKAF
jgi:apolipoprotein N-acyltransferase